MKLSVVFVSLASALCGGVPVSATVLAPETPDAIFSPFVIGTQGTKLVSKSIAGTALTFTGDLRAAVYRNSLGTLDFYYQVQRTGAGEISNDDIERMSVANFQGYLVDAMFSNADLDGAGIFTAGDNNGAVGTANRNSAGRVLGVSFGATSAALTDNQTSATYIFRTNATNYSDLGTFGVSDGSTFSGRAYEPAAGAVPEAATWAMMVVGFGGMGAVMRRKRLNLLHA